MSAFYDGDHKPVTMPDALYKSVRLICMTFLALQIVSFGAEMLRFQAYLELARAARKPSIEITPDFRAEPKIREQKLSADFADLRR